MLAVLMPTLTDDLVMSFSSLLSVIVKSEPGMLHTISLTRFDVQKDYDSFWNFFEEMVIYNEIYVR